MTKIEELSDMEYLETSGGGAVDDAVKWTQETWAELNAAFAGFYNGLFGLDACGTDTTRQ